MRKPRSKRARSTTLTDNAKQLGTQPDAASMFPIVGVGASAGGLEAFTQFLHALPVNTGMGFVLVQHLDPERESALVDLLSRSTTLPVQQISHGLRVAPNHVYVIPRNASLRIVDGVLRLRRRERSRGSLRPIDTFFESLAQDRREHAIGVVLSGTATDGTLGLEAIKAEGGITFAQDDSAKHDSMPRSAVAAGCVDLVLSPPGIAAELGRIGQHPYVSNAQHLFGADGAAAGDVPDPERDRATATADAEDHSALPSGGKGTPSTEAKRARAEVAQERLDGGQRGTTGYKKILLLLRAHSGVDFSLYRSSTIRRRIGRRVILTKHETLAEYANFLRSNDKELEALYSDVLISVTSFFRNPETFDVLQREVLPKLSMKRNEEPLRCWVLGCSTGQEAYSIAMACIEVTEKLPRMRSIQVFATDLNDALLDKARQGLYSKTLADDLSPQRLRRFFVEEQGGYRVKKVLRDLVVFARQNLISDPPFSRLDLISCRNLLIYLEPDLQKRAIPTFHYALKPDGVLLLGASESVAGYNDLFEPLYKNHKIYLRKASSTFTLPLPLRSERANRPMLGVQEEAPSTKLQTHLRRAAGAELSAQREADRLTLQQFAPPGVLVNAELQVVQFRGATDPFLVPPAGKASFDVLKMAREGLMLPLRTAIQQATKQQKTVRKENVRVRRDGLTRAITIEVTPLKKLGERCFLILFVEAAASSQASNSRPVRARATRSSGHQATRIAELESELADTRDYLQSVQEQYEASSEEVQAANEELQSANEELQSMNEELETSKEELESANEELTTVNEEMANRNLELSRLNGDLLNFQASAGVSVLLLGRDLSVRRFSAQAERQFDLLASDIGRSVEQIRHGLTRSASSSGESSSFDLPRITAGVIADGRSEEFEVMDRHGRWHSLRIRPYMTLENRIDGAVWVLTDVDAVKQGERQVAAARDYAENVIASVREPLLVLDEALHVESANPAFYRTFQVTAAETTARPVYELGNGQWDIPELRKLLEEIVPLNTSIDDYMVEHDFPTIGRRTMLINARRVVAAGDARQRVLIAIEDISERRRADLAVARNYAELQEHATDLSRFNRVAVGRELRMIELKKEINVLLRERGEAPRYPLDFDDDATSESRRAGDQQ